LTLRVRKIAVVVGKRKGRDSLSYFLSLIDDETNNKNPTKKMSRLSPGCTGGNALY